MRLARQRADDRSSVSRYASQKSGGRAVAGSRHLIKKLLNRKKYEARAGNGLQSGTSRSLAGTSRHQRAGNGDGQGRGGGSGGWGEAETKRGRRKETIKERVSEIIRKRESS